MLLTNWLNNIRHTFIASNIAGAKEYTIYENKFTESIEIFYTVIVRERLSDKSDEMLDIETKSFVTMEQAFKFIETIHDPGIQATSSGSR